jgi:hypothetical protein
VRKVRKLYRWARYAFAGTRCRLVLKSGYYCHRFAGHFGEHYSILEDVLGDG